MNIKEKERIGLSEKDNMPMSRGVDGIHTQVGRFSSDRSIQNFTSRIGCMYKQITETLSGGF